MDKHLRQSLVWYKTLGLVWSSQDGQQTT